MSGPIERVVVTLDAASENRAAIDTAARLAARTGAALHGVFVEDEELLHLAALPFARQITIGTGAEKLSSDDIALQLRAEAARARRELTAAARSYRVDCTFEVIRGGNEVAIAGASERDLVVAGGLTRPIGRHFRVEARRWSSLRSAAAPGPLLLARTAWTAAGSVVILLRDRGAASMRLFDAAAQIAAASGSVLAVLSSPGDAGAAAFDRWVADRGSTHRQRVQIEAAPAEPSALRERLRLLDCRLVAIEAGSAEDNGNGLRKFVEGFACDMLIVP